MQVLIDEGFYALSDSPDWRLLTLVSDDLKLKNLLFLALSLSFFISFLFIVCSILSLKFYFSLCIFLSYYLFLFSSISFVYFPITSLLKVSYFGNDIFYRRVMAERFFLVNVYVD